MNGGSPTDYWMFQEKCLNNMIYELPTFVFFNLDQGKYLSRISKKNKLKFNLIYAYDQLVWQGPFYIKKIFSELEDEKLNCIAECMGNTGFVLSLLRIGIRKLNFFSQNVNLNKKVLNLAEKYDSKIFLFKKFKKIHVLSKANEINFYQKELQKYLEKEYF